MRPRTAFVILNWNSGEMTAECIRSILAMHSKDYEIVVVDNGSHDGSVDHLRSEFPQITIFPQKSNLGFAAGCNVGMRYALVEGFEYVLPLNNDTLVDPHFLTALLTEAERVRDAAILSPKIYFYDAPDRLWWGGGSFSLWTGIARHVGRKQIDNGQCDSPRAIHWATGCAALIKCDALRSVGVFNEKLFGNGEDLDLSLRMRRAGHCIWFAPQAKLWHKEGVDYRKNAGEYVRKFTGTRNVLWIMREYASKAQWISFLPNFIFRYALFYILLSILRRDHRSAMAVCRGIVAFWRADADADRFSLASENNHH
jgi:GT2 family glycosyltransferase